MLLGINFTRKAIEIAGLNDLNCNVCEDESLLLHVCICLFVLAVQHLAAILFEFVLIHDGLLLLFCFVAVIYYCWFVYCCCLEFLFWSCSSKYAVYVLRP